MCRSSTKYGLPSITQTVVTNHVVFSGDWGCKPAHNGYHTHFTPIHGGCNTWYFAMNVYMDPSWQFLVKSLGPDFGKSAAIVAHIWSWTMPLCSSWGCRPTQNCCHIYIIHMKGVCNTSYAVGRHMDQSSLRSMVIFVVKDFGTSAEYMPYHQAQSMLFCGIQGCEPAQNGCHIHFTPIHGGCNAWYVVELHVDPSWQLLGHISKHDLVAINFYYFLDHCSCNCSLCWISGIWYQHLPLCVWICHTVL